VDVPLVVGLLVQAIRASATVRLLSSKLSAFSRALMARSAFSRRV
jgi:hypothetical protein